MAASHNSNHRRCNNLLQLGPRMAIRVALQAERRRRATISHPASAAPGKPDRQTQAATEALLRQRQVLQSRCTGNHDVSAPPPSCARPSCQRHVDCASEHTGHAAVTRFVCGSGKTCLHSEGLVKSRRPETSQGSLRRRPKRRMRGHVGQRDCQPHERCCGTGGKQIGGQRPTCDCGGNLH